jgi:hypothetical protein
MKRGESLRARHSGGPEGATWNWYGSDLVCSVVVRGTCDGTGDVVLRLGRVPATRAAVALTRRGPARAELRVPAKIWEGALEAPSDLAYETLALAVQVDARCAGGSAAPAPRTWSDGFVGAFSGGE